MNIQLSKKETERGTTTMNFNNIQFCGIFRPYQQRVLDNAYKYLKDGKINIVAAPGSGKTVLGLELIRRLASPCIILSPTTAIRKQWGVRFKEFFLKDKHDFDVLFSEDLHTIRLINSVTYQALYTAVDKVSPDEECDIDCSDVDLFAEIKKHGIKTICLDEAHHLKNEWQKALEKFISELGSDVKIISLTATPPYDSDGLEWSRYMNICGEIDEEIFVPELVGQNTLCPHQDYIYFNYPTKAELTLFNKHKEQAIYAIEEIRNLTVINDIYHALNGEKNYEVLFNNVKEYVSLLVLLHHYGFEINKRLIRQLTTKRNLPFFTIQYAETAIQFLLDGNLISDEQKKQIIDILKTNSVYDKRKVTLVLNEKLKRLLLSSVGKLESIKQITKSELLAMSSKLRMLILTDYIKKENLTRIATTDDFNSVNVVSIFETLRRYVGNVPLGVLSGSLVILPESIDFSSIKYKKENIPGTEYCTVDFSGSNHNMVNFVSKLFESGEVQILIGTKSLLGEGWDSPCINSLIIASFVGSFVLSNQMRGRAIRIDRDDPNKTANIWHLVTVEPDYLIKEKVTERIKKYINQDQSVLTSYDFDVLKRRFDSFMGPNYTTGVIESGIERMTVIAPPYNKDSIECINDKMLALAAKREDVATKWKNEVADGKFAVTVETDIPKEKRVPVFTFFNFFLCGILFLLEMVMLQTILPSTILNKTLLNLGFSKIFLSLILIAITILLSTMLYKGIKKLFLHFNPARSISSLGIAVYNTLCKCNLISSSAKVETNIHKELCFVAVYLRNASVHDQNIFNTAMAEMLSPIENPKYVLIARGDIKRYNYELSFACPSIIGRKKEFAEIFADELKETTGKFKVIYTHRENGRRLILKCRKRSYITSNEKVINKKYKVTHWE